MWPTDLGSTSNGKQKEKEGGVRPKKIDLEGMHFNKRHEEMRGGMVIVGLMGAREISLSETQLKKGWARGTGGKKKQEKNQK